MKAPALLGLFLIFVVLMNPAGTARSDEPPGPGRGAQAAMGTAFPFQGSLKQAGSPATGSYDFRFILYDSEVGGSQVGSIVERAGVSVSGGLFNVTLDFGAAAFDGQARWMEVAVRPAGSGDLTPLAPRQALSPAPYALYATSAASAGSATSATTAASATSATTAATAPWSGLIGVPAGFADGVDNDSDHTGAYWSTSGNAGTSGANFLGTTDNTPLVLQVGGVPALRLEKDAGGSVNVIEGFVWPSGGNSVSPGVINATIGGGGGVGSVSVCCNHVTDHAGTVSGGRGNRAGDDAGTVDDAIFATVGGGQSNTASGIHSTIGGGLSNNASGAAGSVGGGNSNAASGNDSTVGGGISNTASGSRSAVGGGTTNTAGGINSTVGGGTGNNATGEGSTVAGGGPNTASGFFSAVAGGGLNTASGRTSIVAGGEGNTAGGDWSTVAGGQNNTASSVNASIGGGGGNTASGSWSTVVGGLLNTASGSRSTVAGGQSNEAGGNYSFAAGRAAKIGATHEGTFLFADSSTPIFNSTGAKQFGVRATGGAFFVSGIDGTGAATAGVFLSAGGNAWAPVSDRSVKANFVPVDGQEVLARVAAMPLSTWNLQSQDPSIRHMGPMAQDFYAAFGLGEDDLHISTVNADGVALAAIQGLNQAVEEKEARIAALEAQNAALEARLAALEVVLAGGGAP